MKTHHRDLTGGFLGEVRRVIVEVYPPRINRCLKQLSEKEIWWRPNRASNSLGNLVLHLQ